MIGKKTWEISKLFLNVEIANEFMLIQKLNLQYGVLQNGGHEGLRAISLTAKKSSYKATHPERYLGKPLKGTGILPRCDTHSSHSL